MTRAALTLAVLMVALVGCSPVAPVPADASSARTTARTPTETRGRCLIIREGKPQHADAYDYSWCNEAPSPGNLTGKEILAKHPSLPKLVSRALRDAEAAVCGASMNCLTRTQLVRVVVTSNRDPRIYVASSDRNSITIFMRDALVDLIDGVSKAHLDDMVNAMSGAQWEGGLRGVLRRLAFQAGKPCSYRVAFPSRLLTDKEEEASEVYAHIAYTLVLGHELSHVRLGRRCGATTDELAEIEGACDGHAAGALLRAAIPPPSLIAFMTSRWHLDSLLAGLDGQSMTSASDEWSQRSRKIVDAFEQTCRSQQQTPAHQQIACRPGWEDMIRELRELIDLPLPAPCDGSATTPQSLQATPVGPTVPETLGARAYEPPPSGAYCASDTARDNLLCGHDMTACETKRLQMANYGGTSMGPCMHRRSMWCTEVQFQGQLMPFCSGFLGICLLGIKTLEGRTPSIDDCKFYESSSH